MSDTVQAAAQVSALEDTHGMKGYYVDLDSMDYELPVIQLHRNHTAVTDDSDDRHDR